MGTFSTYEDYTRLYRGALPAAAYDAAAGEAYAEILSQTGGRAATGAAAGMARQLCLCECALADAVHGFAQRPAGAVAVNNDGYAVSWGGAAEREAAVRGICARYLQAPVNLMSRWL